MEIKIDKKKIVISLVTLIIITGLVVIYQNYDFNSIITYDNNNISVEQDNSKESDSITEKDIVFPDTILLDGPKEIIDYNNITFSWTGNDDVTQTRHLLYSYKLENKDSEWSFWTTLNTKTYRNLSNGNYTFFVKTIDEAGNIDPDPIERFFTVDIAFEKTELKTYYVYWPIVTNTIPLNESYFAGKRQPFQKIISIPQQNLKQINFKINWEDDFTSPIFHFGKDVLTFFIKLSDDELFNERSIGQGSLSYNISNINEKPTITDIKAENLSSANTIIQQYFGSKLTDEQFIIDVEVKVRELRILPRLRDKGNDFTLEISYEYYEPQFSELEDSPPETTITSGPKDTTYENNIKFSWKGSDDFSTEDQLRYSYKLEPFEKTWSEWAYETSVNYYDLRTGEYIFFVRAIDHMDIVDPTPAERLFYIKEPETDEIDPTIEILSGPSGITKDTTHTFTWIGSDDKTPIDSLKYRYKLDGKYNDWSNWDNTTEKTYTNIYNGQYTFIVEVLDASNNKAEAKQFFTVEQWNKSRFVTKIIEFTPGQSASSDLELLFGEPQGCGEYCGSTDVLILGDGGIVTVGFEVIIINDPGYDFIVFENPFFVTGNTEEVFAELVYVEVSTDNVSFARFPSISTTKNPVGNKGININNVTNLAGVQPVLANVFENNLNPFNPEESGGDAFDLDDLIDDPLVQSGLVDLNNINYIKLIDIPGDGSCFDSLGNPIYDPTEPDINGADIDAISVINYKVEN